MTSSTAHTVCVRSGAG